MNLPVLHKPPRLLTVAEFADAIRVSERHVRTLIAAGRVPAFRVGKRRLRVDVDEALRRLRGEG